MKSSFISEDAFLDEMCLQWQGFGNSLSGSFKDAWRTILKTFNNQIAGKPGLHVCDSVCGSGKTLSAEVAATILSRDWESVGTLIVVRLTNQCVDVASRINEMSERLIGKPIARPMFSHYKDENAVQHNGSLTDEEIADTQVIVITHSRYLSAVSGRCSDRFSRWRMGERKFRVVDESLDLVERSHITKPQLLSISQIIELRKDFSGSFLERYLPHYNLFNAIKTHLLMNVKGSGYYENLFEDIIQQHLVDGNPIYFAEMDEVLQTSTPKDYDGKFREGEFSTFIEEGMEGLATIDRMIRRSLYFCTHDTPKFCTGEIILPTHFKSLCVLDATSNVDKIYSLFKQREQITTYSIDRSVRNFRNCTIHLRPERGGLGKTVTKKVAEPRARKIINWAQQEFGPEDKVLFAGHKLLMDSLTNQLSQADPGFEWDVCWWNAIDGRNTWKGYNKLVVLSLFYLPKHYGPTTKIGFRSSHNADVVVDDNEDIANSAMAVKLIQLLARIKTRKVINEQGDCPESNIYMLLPSTDEVHPDDEDDTDFGEVTNSLSKYLLTELKQSMNGVRTQNWTSFGGFETNRPTTNTISDKFIAWIATMKAGDTRDKKSFESQITETEKNTLKCLLNDPNSRVGRRLSALRITRKTKRGRGGTTTFTKVA